MSKVKAIKKPKTEEPEGVVQPKPIGVIASIFEMVKSGPHSKGEVLVKLQEQFPDRKVDSMKSTIGVQIPGRMSREKNVKIIRDADGRYYVQAE